MDGIKLDMLLGRIELQTFRKFENGRMITYSYGISYDQNGVETGRTEPTEISSIGWDNGEPFTEADYRKLAGE